MYFNNDIEICAGKKNKFPKKLPSFKRKLKPKPQYEKEKKDAQVLFFVVLTIKSGQLCLVVGSAAWLQTYKVSLQNKEE